ncbi:1-phosphofructokinase [Actinomadura rubrobrunea]|uniref:1-phosphofructokinase n=1 Tax=Actinomadura rubrobrunea TaxID=115335 RepID=UPI001D03989F|nr:1-phosphofructokinase [Actinomadura rubrobrunea]
MTANPSVDRTVEVDALARGTVIRARAAHVDPGGKGVNVSRALAALGHKTRAVLPSGGAEGRQLADLLAADGIELVLVPIRGAVRANVSVVEPDGTVTKLNEPGPYLVPDESAAVAEAVRTAAAQADWVVLAGSLPPGVPEDFYARLAETLRRGGTRVAIDSSGPAFASALTARPHLVKPNREELAEAAGMPVATLGDAVAAAGVLRARGADAVLASLGADGALLVDDGGAVHGEAPVPVPRSTVGAGDALLAGFLAAGGCGARALAEGLAWAAAATGLPGSRMPAPADLDRTAVRLHDTVETGRALRERDPA